MNLLRCNGESQNVECDGNECSWSEITLKDGRGLQFPENLNNNGDITDISIRDSAVVVIPEVLNEKFPNMQTIFLFRSVDLEKFERNFFESQFNGVKFLRIFDDVFTGSKKRLESIEENAFGNLPNMEDLILQEIQIGNLNEKAFASNKNLKSIRIQLTKLKSLPAKIFRGLVELEKIKITDNNIKTLHKNMFQDNKRLKFIDFFYNQIEDLPENIFSNLVYLEKINFRLNKIEILNGKLFQNNDNLKEINFEENMITKIVPGTFSGLKSLESVNLGLNICVNAIFHNSVPSEEMKLIGFVEMDIMDDVLLQCYE